jgi:hypothetical protein
MSSGKRRRRINVYFRRGDLWLITTKRYQLTGGLTIRLRENYRRPGAPAAFSPAAHFIVERAVEIPLDLAIAYVGAWLYDTLKGFDATITMDRKDLAVKDKRAVKKFLKQHIERTGTSPSAGSKRSKPVRKPTKRQPRRPTRRKRRT